MSNEFAASRRRGHAKPARDVADLRDTLSFRVIHLVNLVSKPFFSRYAKRYDLSINEWRVLAAIAEQPGLTASEIAADTGMHEMNVSRAVRVLARKGRVSRALDPRDRRRAPLRVTPEGAAIFAKVAAGAHRREAELRRALTEGELLNLTRLLDRLIETMTEVANRD